MSFERYIARFDRAVMVKKGEAQDYDLLMRDGQSALKRSPRHVAPSVVVPLALSGVARPGETMTVIPGEYAGQPAPQITRTLLRDGVADGSFDGSAISITAADVGRRLTVVETARNASGQVQTSAEAVVSMLAPTALLLSTATAAVSRDLALPQLLAEIRADGDLPLVWALSDGLGGALLIEEAGATARLKLVAMPANGEHAVQVSATNGAGSASADFILSVAEPALVAPSRVTLSRETCEIPASSALPVVLADLAADGTAPLDWSVIGGGANVEIKTDGAVPQLVLTTMPLAGQHHLNVAAENGAGMAQAIFTLTVSASATAPSTVALSAASATLAADAALPVDLAVLSSDGTAPLDWSLEGGNGAFALELDGLEPVLRLVAMPAVGAHAVTVRATNAEGSAEAGFALTVTAAEPAPVAPTAVALSAASAQVAADAALPIALAVLSADGTAPLDWSLDGGNGAFALDLTGPQPVLRLVAMPAIGAHPVTVRARNAAGSAEAGFALTVTAVEIAPVAPTAVVLSAASAEIAADAALPVDLAVLSADGTAPLYWSLEGGNGSFALDLGGATPALRLVSRPPVGEHAVTIRATNAAGSAEAVFALSVIGSGALVTSGHGTILSASTEADGSITFVLDEGGTEGVTYSVPADKVAAGYATMLVPPTITEAPAGTYTVTDPGLYVAPADDPATVLYRWIVADQDTGQTGETYVRSSTDALKTGQLQIMVTNRAMAEAHAEEVSRIGAWTEPVFDFAPMYFRAPQNDCLTWALPGLPNQTKAFMFSRFTYRPDATDTDLSGRILDLAMDNGLTALGMYRENSANQFKFYFRGLSTTGSYFARFQGATVAIGDQVDVIMSFGAPVSTINLAPAVHIRHWINGVASAPYTITPPAGMVLNMAGTPKLIVGGKTSFSPNDGGISHEQYRSGLWLGAAMAPDVAYPLLVKGNGALANPEIISGALGVTPLLDLYNSNNNGSLGAPATMSDLS